jgi:CRISPR-associated protein Cmr6
MSDYDKTPIGCHWEWRNAATFPAIVRVQSPGDLTGLLRRSRQLAERWLQAQGERTGVPAPWREVIHPDRMLIWSRRADNVEDAEAIHWFHRPREGDSRRDPRDLRKSDLAGRVNQVGLLWNRLLPIEAGGSEKPLPQVSASPMARPGAAMARPGAATARPAAGAMARPSTARQAPAPKGEVWMNHSAGPFLESLVLFPEQRESPDFIKVMDRGDDAGFERVRF